MKYCDPKQVRKNIEEMPSESETEKLFHHLLKLVTTSAAISRPENEQTEMFLKIP